MGFFEATKTCLRKYVTFSGRASRSEFWWFWLFVILLSIVGVFLDFLIFGAAALEDDGPALISGIFSLGTFLPLLTVTIRRLHDTGRAWYYIFTPIAFALVGVVMSIAVGFWFVVIAVLAGYILFFVWHVLPSDPETNRYGRPPGSPEFDAEVFS